MESEGSNPILEKAKEWRQANRDSGNGSSSKRLACSTKVGVGDAGKDGVLSF